MKQKLLEYIESLYKEDMTAKERISLEKTAFQVHSLSEEQCKQLVEDKFPFLVEKELMRDRVERVITTGLNKTKPDDKEVTYLDYMTVVTQVEGIIHNMSHERIVMGFTPEDLESFMEMKIHQVLRRGQYDFNRSAKSYFQFVFRNLINDINKCKDSAVKSCDLDAMVDCVDLNNVKGQDWLDES